MLLGILPRNEVPESLRISWNCFQYCFYWYPHLLISLPDSPGLGRAADVKRSLKMYLGNKTKQCVSAGHCFDRHLEDPVAIPALYCLPSSQDSSVI